MLHTSTCPPSSAYLFCLSSSCAAKPAKIFGPAVGSFISQLRMNSGIILSASVRSVGLIARDLPYRAIQVPRLSSQRALSTMDTNLGRGDDAVATLRGVLGFVFSRYCDPFDRIIMPHEASLACLLLATSWRDCRSCTDCARCCGGRRQGTVIKGLVRNLMCF